MLRNILNIPIKLGVPFKNCAHWKPSIDLGRLSMKFLNASDKKIFIFAFFIPVYILIDREMLQIVFDC